jgi:chaperonin cofactor prefoldin
MKKHKYKVVEENEDPKYNVIEKSNVTVKFSIADMEDDERRLGKFLSEIEAKHEVENAKMDNITRNHPVVLKLTEQERFTVHMYQESERMANAVAAKIAEVKDALEEIRADKEEIYKQIGFPVSLEALEPVATEEEPDEEVIDDHVDA